MLKITKKGDKAWVTFSMMPTSEEKVFLSGEWNDWKEEEMKSKKNGEFYLRKFLKCDNEYQFGYKTENAFWICDNETPTIDSPFGTKNSVLKI